MIADRECRPRLAPKARLRFDRHGGTYLLLAPERGLVLNAPAAAIVVRCDGTRTVGAIAEQLAADYATSPSDVQAEVAEFIAALAVRGLIVEDA